MPENTSGLDRKVVFHNWYYGCPSIPTLFRCFFLALWVVGVPLGYHSYPMYKWGNNHGCYPPPCLITREQPKFSSPRPVNATIITCLHGKLHHPRFASWLGDDPGTEISPEAKFEI
jgi:hypothetical protein